MPSKSQDAESATVVPASTQPLDNLLIAALPETAYVHLRPRFEECVLERGVILHDSGDDIVDLYFPLTCLISITVTMKDSRTAETAVVGSREVSGINAFMGGRESTHTRYVVQIPGDAIRIPADVLLELFDRDKGTRDVLLKYTQAMLAQVTQNAACNALHNIEQRYARWLLEARDRIRSDEVQLTQVFISEMLGVRRAGIAEVSGKFERAGAVHNQRGRTRIIDGAQLETAACECYSILSTEYDRLLGPHVAQRSNQPPPGAPPQRSARSSSRPRNGRH
jgi:CRP-like cAMP-binding protein